MKDAINPDHYRQGSIECIEAIEAATINKTGIEAACVANVIKYLWRYEAKNGLEDVKKARWYMDKLIEVLTRCEPSGEAADGVSVEPDVPDWENAPEWAQWVAQDGDGEWYWYEFKPEESGFFWSNTDDKFIFAIDGESNPNWRETLQARPNNDGWIEWHGGECPVDASTVVQVMFKGIAKIGCQAGVLRWQHHGNDNDIIAYRIIK